MSDNMNVRNSEVMSFDIGKTVNYWLESAVYDLETGKSLLESKKFPYALFFAHLAIEKVLKAIVVKQTGEHAPYTHSLVLLAKKANIKMTEEMLDQLAEYKNFILRQGIQMKRRIFTSNAQRNLLAKKLRKWIRYING